MKLPDHRRKFSHPDIPIDVERLREIISAGDDADQALQADHHRRYAEVTTGTALATGRLAELHQRREALRSQLARANGDAQASITASIRENEAQIRDEAIRVEAARAPLFAAVQLRDRCVAYALEAGMVLPELRRFDVSQMVR